MFEISGAINAEGTLEDHITFDGNGVAYIFKQTILRRRDF
jgi:hypothetical protein